MWTDFSGEKQAKNQIKHFWHTHPNARHLVKGRETTKEFFEEHDRIIDDLSPYLPLVLDYEGCSGKRVLEVGCGMGGQARFMAQKAKEFFAVDLAPKSIELTRKRFAIYNLNPFNILQSDAENLPFKNEVFDRVCSNGVIHSTPNTPKAAREIYRVLKKDSEAVIMVYYKNSIFWWYDLMIRLRVYYTLVKILPEPIIRLLARLRPSLSGLKEDLNKTAWPRLGEYCLAACDGQGNPHNKVYTKKQARELFKDFSRISFDVRGLRNKFFDRFRFIEKRFGFLLFIYLKK